MKNLVITGFLLLGALVETHGQALPARPQRQAPQQPSLQRGLRPNLRADRPINTQDAVLAFYVNQFRQAANVSPEVFNKALPFLADFVQNRFEISRRRTRILNTLRQTVNRNGSDDEIKRLVRDLDAADAESQTNQERFFNNVDPLLTARQQARVRILINMADNRIRELLNAAQNPPANAPADSEK
jgi:hypothetical protein